jgi:hypothetical protein
MSVSAASLGVLSKEADGALCFPSTALFEGLDVDDEAAFDISEFIANALVDVPLETLQTQLASLVWACKVAIVRSVQARFPAFEALSMTVGGARGSIERLEQPADTLARAVASLEQCLAHRMELVETAEATALTAEQRVGQLARLLAAAEDVNDCRQRLGWGEEKDGVVSVVARVAPNVDVDEDEEGKSVGPRWRAADVDGVLVVTSRLRRAVDVLRRAGPNAPARETATLAGVEALARAAEVAKAAVFEHLHSDTGAAGRGLAAWSVARGMKVVDAAAFGVSVVEERVGVCEAVGRGVLVHWERWDDECRSWVSVVSAAGRRMAVLTGTSDPESDTVASLATFLWEPCVGRANAAWQKGAKPWAAEFPASLAASLHALDDARSHIKTIILETTGSSDETVEAALDSVGAMALHRELRRSQMEVVSSVLCGQVVGPLDEALGASVRDATRVAHESLRRSYALVLPSLLEGSGSTDTLCPGFPQFVPQAVGMCVLITNRLAVWLGAMRIALGDAEIAMPQGATRVAPDAESRWEAATDRLRTLRPTLDAPSQVASDVALWGARVASARDAWRPLLDDLHSIVADANRMMVDESLVDWYAARVAPAEPVRATFASLRARLASTITLVQSAVGWLCARLGMMVAVERCVVAASDGEASLTDWAASDLLADHHSQWMRSALVCGVLVGAEAFGGSAEAKRATIKTSIQWLDDEASKTDTPPKDEWKASLASLVRDTLSPPADDAFSVALASLATEHRPTQ